MKKLEGKIAFKNVKLSVLYSMNGPHGDYILYCKGIQTILDLQQNLTQYYIISFN
jgi:hypothetical protein